MNYTEFVNAVKEKLTQELNGDVRVNVYTMKKIMQQSVQD